MGKRTETEDRERYSTGDLARLIQASRTTVVRWIEEGRLRARRTVGGWYIIPRDEVVQFLWDLTFSKDTPIRIWQAASAAYERLTAADEARKAKAPPPPKKARG